MKNIIRPAVTCAPGTSSSASLLEKIGMLMRTQKSPYWDAPKGTAPAASWAIASWLGKEGSRSKTSSSLLRPPTDTAGPSRGRISGGRRIWPVLLSYTPSCHLLSDPHDALLKSPKDFPTLSYGATAQRSTSLPFQLVKCCIPAHPDHLRALPPWDALNQQEKSHKKVQSKNQRLVYICRSLLQALISGTVGSHTLHILTPLSERTQLCLQRCQQKLNRELQWKKRRQNSKPRITG